MGYIKDNYQTIKQFFKDVKNGINDIGLRLNDLESRREDVLGGGALPQEEENGKEYKAGEGILITDDDSVVLNYNGPFAYHLDHIDTTTTTTLWVTRSVGYVVRNGVRKTIDANTTPAVMASGESAWMLYDTDDDLYSISIQTNAPTATSDKICVKLAENVNGVLRQIQFGEVVVTTGGGIVQDISANVSDGTATIALSGSTSTVEIVGGTSGNVTISGNTNGQVVIDATGGGGSYDVFPDYNSNPVNISGGTVYTANGNVWLIGTVGIYKKSSSTETPSVTLMIYSEGTLIRTRDVFIEQGVYSSLSTWNVNTNFVVPISIPIPSGFQFEVTKSDSAQFNISMYSCITAPPLNRTVTTPSGTGDGSLFRALSDDGDANISFEQSLDGTPIDFEGASVL